VMAEAMAGEHASPSLLDQDMVPLEDD